MASSIWLRETEESTLELAYRCQSDNSIERLLSPSAYGTCVFLLSILSRKETEAGEHQYCIENRAAHHEHVS